MADSIATHSRILSAAFEAKADTKDGADGLSLNKRNKRHFRFLHRSQLT